MPRGLGLLLALLALAALLGGWLLIGDRGLIKMSQLEKEQARLEATNSALRRENRLLREKIDRMKTDPAYIEDEARKKLGLVKPDEEIYKVEP